MKSITNSFCLVALGWILTGASGESPERMVPTVDHQSVLMSSGEGSRYKNGAGSDTFCLYGGPGSLKGKFQHADLTPLTREELLNEPTTVPGEADGWVFADETEQEIYWQVSTFSMANLNSNGPGNQGMWVGRSASQVGWANAPGYGNSWNALMEWRTSDFDPAQGQVVSLDWFYNFDTEATFDFFEVEYDSAGTTVIALSVSGTSKGSVSGVFDAPGVIGSLNLPYDADSYANGNSEIVLRMAGRSDGGYADEDGIIDTDGLVQVDDITVGWTDAGGSPAVDTDSFEGGDLGPNWTPVQPPYAGFFGQVFPVVEDLDPCRSNLTPAFGFIDDGTLPANPSYSGTGTGGTTSLNWSYGIPGNWVINYNGGITNNQINLQNYLHTPAIAWDLPGTADDAPEVAGVKVRADIWRHNPLLNGLFYMWKVRARDSVTQEWTGFADRGFVYYGSAAFRLLDLDVSDLMVTPNGPDGVQFCLGTVDAANVFAFPGSDAVISPVYDNIGVFKYRIGGPTITTRTIDLFQDSFPQSGLIASGTAAERDGLDIRIDMARDVSTGTGNSPGDSIIVDVTNVIPGSSIAADDIRLHWALHTNPYFEDALRLALTAGSGVSGPYAESAGAGHNGWDVWRGVEGVVGGGEVANERYAFDLPDADFMYPGDVLEWYIEATDDGGATGGTPLTSTFPASLAGFGDANKHNYNTVFTVRGLPTITSSGQPNLLLVNDFGHRGGENEYLSAFGQLGYERGGRAADPLAAGDYDIYTVFGPSSGVSNGIGSEGAHGADASQISGYNCVVYVAGNLSSFLLSDGSDSGLNDKGDDIGNLTDWHNQAADRYTVYFGDGIGTSVSASSTVYLNTIMGVDYLGFDVSSSLGGVLAPLVEPTSTGSSAGFVADWVAYGACPSINTFDVLAPFSASAENYVSHEFQGGSPMVPSTAPAGIVFDRMDAGFRKVNATFPHGLTYLQNGGSAGAGGGISDRAVLLSELFGFFGRPSSGGGEVTPVEPLPPEHLSLYGNYPNPFNPSTEIRFSLGVKGPVTVKVYNLAGRVVRTLALDEVRDAGLQSVTWHGRDDSGKSVASGVYIARVVGNGYRKHLKLALVK